MIQRAREKVELIKAVAVWTFFKAARNLSEQPDENAAINPCAISLQPDRWEQDGLYAGDGDGITLPGRSRCCPGLRRT